MKKIVLFITIGLILSSFSGCEIIKKIIGNPLEKDTVAPKAIRSENMKTYTVGDEVSYDTILTDVIGNPLYCTILDNVFDYPNGITVVFPTQTNYQPDSSKYGLQKIYFNLYDENGNIGIWDYIVICFVGGDSTTPMHDSIDTVVAPTQEVVIKGEQ